MACLSSLDYAISGRKEKVEEVSAAVKVPTKKKSKHQKASVSHAAPITESAEEVSKDFESR